MLMCILLQLWQDCEYRGSDLNPFKFQGDTSTQWSGLDWLIFDNLRGGLKNQAFGEGLKTTQLCTFTAVCTPCAHSAAYSWELPSHSDPSPPFFFFPLMKAFLSAMKSVI